MCCARKSCGTSILLWEKQTVREVDNYQVLDTYVRPEDEQSPQNAFFQQEEASPRITAAVCYLLDEVFPNS